MAILFNMNFSSLRVTFESRGIETLYGGNTTTKDPFVGNKERILKNVGSSGQIINKEVGGIVSGTLIVAQTILPSVSTEGIGGLQRGGSTIF